MLIAMRTLDEALIDAADAEATERGVSFLCPNPACRRSVIPRVRGRLVSPHFAHAPGIATQFCPGGESPRHRDMKRQMARLLGAQFVQFEAWLADGPTLRRADILARAHFGEYVVECQASRLSDRDRRAEIEARTRDHNAMGRPVLWVWDLDLLLPPEDRGPCVYRIPHEVRDGVGVLGLEVRASQSLKWNHQAAFGRVYALDRCGHLVVMNLRTEARTGSEWYDREGNERSSSGYYPKRLRRPWIKTVTSDRVRQITNGSLDVRVILLGDEQHPGWHEQERTRGGSAAGFL
jgi:hypothetical protein